eukprot:SAG31_NODE_386_length_16407_cov_24.639686_4_plen_94_part_00
MRKACGTDGVNAANWDAGCGLAKSRVDSLRNEIQNISSTLDISTTMLGEVNLLASEKPEDQQKGANAIACLTMGYSRQAGALRPFRGTCAHCF